ncbi:GntR family transcriptional regulator [Enterorhabdus mucosicola]|uniref:GntR family transcriptional regulator n=1 Tax=Adlercreutzia mucosicola TaxID=580026 RepID=A0A6N8JSI1_9ACTN|nr:GntR family transcriptional regulator [Adlercreutzia mucosicola]MVX61800.1 GntR family transcriptional regulator [Adlercreutzia mucosicola]
MHLDDRLDTPLYQQLFDQLRHRIEEGDQPEGSRLPPIRSMAADLGCARNTVENAYALLAQEGYVKSRPGSGYIVQNVAFVQADADRGALLAEPLIGAKASRARYDFTYSDLEPGTFPAMTWRAITDDILLSVESTGCDAYNDPLGEESLRAAIAWRLSTQRGIDCTPAQIVVQGGTQTSVQNLLALFDPVRDAVAMEDPLRRRAHGHRAIALPAGPMPGGTRHRRLSGRPGGLGRTPRLPHAFQPVPHLPRHAH